MEENGPPREEGDDENHDDGEISSGKRHRRLERQDVSAETCGGGRERSERAGVSEGGRKRKNTEKSREKEEVAPWAFIPARNLM